MESQSPASESVRRGTNIWSAKASATYASHGSPVPLASRHSKSKKVGAKGLLKPMQQQRFEHQRLVWRRVNRLARMCGPQHRVGIAPHLDSHRHLLAAAKNLG